jgi:probable rRNA maturation factor
MTSPYQIEVRVDPKTEFVFENNLIQLIERAVAQTLIHENFSPPAEITVLITSDKIIRQMNQTYRRLDKATDVLSFPRGEEIDGAQSYLGDIAISAQFARDQATRFGHRFEDELQLLGVHATLHLLGYDHASPKEKEHMWLKQSLILESVGVKDIYVPDEAD